MTESRDVNVSTRTGGYVTRVSDGRVFHDSDPEQFVKRLLDLKEQGFEVPEDAIARAQQECEAP